MLVLGRKRNERIIISDGDRLIVITVADIRGDKVRIGIDAPRETIIDREEVHQAKQRGGAR